MASENMMNNNQILCSNGCGFFGTPATMNLCSKCYRDHRLKEENQSVQKSPSLTEVADRKPAESSSETTPPLSLTPVVDRKPAESSSELTPPSSLTQVVELKPAESSSETTTPSPAQPTPPPPVKTGNCCGSCKRKLKITATYKCKCGSAFCGSHRFPGDHNCSFDYKAAGKEAIAKANPIIKGVKIERL